MRGPAAAGIERAGATGPAGFAGTFGANELFGHEGNDSLVGYAGDDILHGGSGDDILNAGAGADRMYGGEGSDRYYVDDPGDQIFEPAAAGDDVVGAAFSYRLAPGIDIERLEPITLTSTAPIDFTGNEFGNYVIGNNGQNILDGGAGADVLEGLGGQDFFAFTTALGNGNIDRITDFLSGFDRMMLDNSVFTGLTPGTLFASQFAVGQQAQDADDRIIYNPATGALLFDADGTGSGAAVQFAFVGANLNITASDFLVVSNRAGGSGAQETGGASSAPDNSQRATLGFEDGAYQAGEGLNAAFGPPALAALHDFSPPATDYILA